MNGNPGWFNSLVVFVLGLEFGSFANVCIFRWPRGASTLHPHRSFCPWCETPIHWFDNVPVLSFLFLGGRCRSCRSPISIRYPLVELAMGVLWLSAYRTLGPSDPSAQLFFLCAVFTFIFTAVVTTMTDLDWRTIPDNATAVLATIGLATAFQNPLLGDGLVQRFQASIVGAAVGAGIIWIIGYLGGLLFGKEAMGGGDVKLLGAMGTVIGWQGAVLTLFLAAFLGGLVAVGGLLTGRLKRRAYIPFGPFLNLAGIASMVIIHRTRKIIDLLM